MTTTRESTTSLTEEEQIIDAPLVFQCLKCRTIFGDSFDFICAEKELNTISLTTASVKTISELITSKSGSDIGCTYFSIACRECKNLLGRIYKTTPKSLDPIRDLYSFNLDCIMSYKLGSTRYIMASEGIPMTDSKNIIEEITKIQEFLLLMNERVLHLERLEAILSNTESMVAEEKQKSTNS